MSRYDLKLLSSSFLTFKEHLWVLRVLSSTVSGAFPLETKVYQINYALHLIVSSKVTQCISLGFSLIYLRALHQYSPTFSADNNFLFFVPPPRCWNLESCVMKRQHPRLLMAVDLLKEAVERWNTLYMEKDQTLDTLSADESCVCVHICVCVCVVLLVGDQPHDGPVFREHFWSD